VGPSYPFCLDSTVKMQSDPTAVLKGICTTYYIDSEQGPQDATFPSLRVPEEIKSLQQMKDLFARGLDELEQIENKNENLLYLINQGHFILHSIITGIHAKQWYCLKCDAKAERNREKLQRIVEKLEQLLKEELENARDAIPYVKRDSRLGWEPSMEYLGDEWHIRWKIRHGEYVLNTELARWRASVLL